mgnify:CR=1 FL=1
MTSPLWIIDEGPFGLLSLNVDHGRIASWPAGEFAVTGTTALAAQRDPSRMRVGALSVKSQEQDGSVIRVIEILTDTDAARVLYEHLRKDQVVASDDLAEHEAIAWALTSGEEAILVTMDRRAALTALAELGRGRVAHAFELWTHLFEAGRIVQDEFVELCRHTLAKDQGLPGIPWYVQKMPTQG